MNNPFRETLEQVKPLRLREPLAETLGALKEDGEALDYTFIDVVKMAGHACPTVSAAYLISQMALERLYPDSVPVRGEIAVIVYGEPDDGVYGVMAQVFSFLTGAAPATGFKGLGPRFKRKDLLRFSPQVLDSEAMCFEFKRLDNGKAVLVRFYSQRVPFPAEKAQQMAKLMHPVIWEAATAGQQKQFQELWMDKIERMLLAREEIDKWIEIEERG
ncbi:MAG: hypothetical protein HYX90_04195 [Chloroflexi bacterium]|nr:hypothetical protein [Chloroflexota bacterium]